MSPTSLITLLLSFILVTLVAGNNISVSTVPIISSRIVKRKVGITIAVLGYLTGFVMQGSMLRTSVTTLLPLGSVLLPVVLLISIAVFILAHLRKIPEPLSVVFTCALFGASIAYGTLNTTFAIQTLSFWLIAAIATIILSFISLGTMQKALYRNKVWTSVSIVRALLIVLSFFTAFTLGANTIGIIYALMPIGVASFVAVLLAIVIGSIFFSSAELKRLGEELLPLRYANALTAQLISVILVEAASVMGIPLSNTQMLTMSIYGERLRYKEKLLSKKPMVQILLVWVATAAISLALAYITATAILAL